MSVETATDGATFTAHLEQGLLPVLRQRKPDAVPVMDNLCPHKPRRSRRCSMDQVFPNPSRSCRVSGWWLCGGGAEGRSLICLDEDVI
jgi:hypothetical protein